ncbi:SDR family NAD(P)-dependent oxidoreductase [Nocardiopsis sp. NPDC058631]|uniref:SDR family NAD(P)-dependent oxidoreductase n=1 Tax=Nocardiopsis sp. NPDC058631 TaxID=3346566 RepID=UPI003669E049
MGQLDDKTALVTGASSGIGLAIAQRLAEEGAQVYLTGRRKDVLDDAVERVGASATGVVADAADTASLDALFQVISERSGRLDVVVANAGFGRNTAFAEVDEEEFDSTFATNVKGTFFTVQKSLPLLVDGASVVLVSSVAGVTGSPGMSVYAATKAAGRNLARSLAAELAPRRIRVNALLPGPTDTPGMTRSQEEVRAAGLPWTIRTPLADLVPAVAVADAALFLASDRSTYITGTDLTADGGSLAA